MSAGTKAGRAAGAEPGDGTGTGAVAAYVAELAAFLHGPARSKERMLAEVREGLEDATAAYERAGLPAGAAARLAVRDSGEPSTLVPSWQRELTVVQTRHTARALAVSLPVLLVCWFLVRAAGHGQGWQSSLLAGAVAVAALLAVAVLSLTGPLARRLPVPHRLPLAVAWAGTTAGAAMGIATLALAVTSVLAANWPLTALACALAAASHAVVAPSARACRRCARLPAEAGTTP